MTKASLRIDRLTDPDAVANVEPLLREYLAWVVAQFATLAADLADDDALIAKHHAMFIAEVPNFLCRRGRLLVARLGGQVVGVGAYKPVDGTTAEIKRMYVRSTFQGHGIGRAILERLLADARADGYWYARLETGSFMTQAQALYRSVGFVDMPAFEHSETAISGLQHLTRYMYRALREDTMERAPSPAALARST